MPYSLDHDAWMELARALIAISMLGGALGALLLSCLASCARALLAWIGDFAERRGMGQRPMVGLSRATCPVARGGAEPARRDDHACTVHPPSGDGQRVMKHGLHPRGAAPNPSWPFSSLINLPPAAGAGRLPSLARADDSPGDSGTGSLGELASRPVLLTPHDARPSEFPCPLER